MNSVVLDNCAFIFPDDMDAFRKRYGADLIYVDGEEGYVAVLGPNDKEWRVLPDDGNPEAGAVVRSIRREE